MTTSGHWVHRKWFRFVLNIVICLVVLKVYYLYKRATAVTSEYKNLLKEENTFVVVVKACVFI